MGPGPEPHEIPASAARDQRTILLVDAQSIFRTGLRKLFEERIAGCRVIEAAACDQAATLNDLDLVLVDEGSLTSCSRDLLAKAYERNPSVRFAVLSASNSRADVLNILSAGFHGFVYKLQSDEGLLAAVRDLLTGRIVAPSWVADVENSAGPPTIQSTPERLKLTHRQSEVLQMLAQGMSNKEIAQRLGIVEGTARIHVTALVRALGAGSRSEAVFLAAHKVRPRSDARA